MTKQIKVKGMICEGCEKRVENVLKEIEGVQEVIANHMSGIVEIRADKEIEKKIIKEKIEDLDFEVEDL